MDVIQEEDKKVKKVKKETSGKNHPLLSSLHDLLSPVSPHLHLFRHYLLLLFLTADS
jgi:hypothetical protein